MKRGSFVELVVVLSVVFGTASTSLAQKHKLVYAKDGSGVCGYKDTPIQPWSGYHVHDPDRPAPPKVTPGDPCNPDGPGAAPSDAVVLFGGKDLSEWQPSDWKVEDGCLVAADGGLTTKKDFGDCQLHVEWMVPTEPTKNMMNHGNNGVMLLGLIEVQIFDSYDEKLYPDGQAASIYAQTPPLVNACRRPGQWQTYDIIFIAPRFDKSHKLLAPARLTVLHNGLLVQYNQEVYGNTHHLELGSYDAVPAKGPLVLAGHHCPVHFRNIWIRPLDLKRPEKKPAAESEPTGP